jgi:hypothetical protein
MKQLIDRVKLRKLLQDGIGKGLWTLEDLDTPPPGFLDQWHDWETACRLESARLGREVPCNFPAYKNPLRDN